MEHLVNQVNLVKNWLGAGSLNVFGMPYSGKDTQGQSLADLLEAELLGGGDILRNSVIPKDVREIMNRGDLVPSDAYAEIVLPYLSHEKFAGRPLILSSVGRKDGEQEGVLRATAAAGHPIGAAILLTVNETTARNRHQNLGSQDRGVRADDNADVFDSRLKVYKQETLPVVEYYRDMGLLIEVDGSLRPIEVTQQIISKLAEKAARVSAPANLTA